VSGVPELVEDGVTGFLVPPRDPGALAAALQRLIADPELRQRMGQAGRKKALKEFTLDPSSTVVNLKLPFKGYYRAWEEVLAPRSSLLSPPAPTAGFLPCSTPRGG